MLKRLRNQRGQGTIEAALAIPVLSLLLLMLLQPGIVLYDRAVMGGAAAEACRVLATKTDAFGSMDRSCEAFVRHRLSAIPQHNCFHVHEGGCTYDISFSGDEDSGQVSVTIKNELRPLPLFDAGATILGMVNGSGNLEIEETATVSAQPAWIEGSKAGSDASSWVGAWCS